MPLALKVTLAESPPMRPPIGALMTKLPLLVEVKVMLFAASAPSRVSVPPAAVYVTWNVSPDAALRVTAGALARKKKVFNFPWQMSVLLWFAQWVPDWIVARAMRRHTDNLPPPKLPS